MDKSINQQLDQKLQESYQQFSVPAPDGVWEQLQAHLPEVALDQQLDDKVQDSYEQQTAVAPNGIWEQLEKDLPATLDEQLDDKIKEGFTEHIAKAAPLAAWSMIAEELNNNTTSLDEQLDDKIKQSYQKEQLRAPQKVWAAVNRQLNIDRTWKRISTALDTPVVTIDWKLRSLQGLVLALLLLLWARTCNKVPTVITAEPMAAKNKQENNPAQTVKQALALLESDKNNIIQLKKKEPIVTPTETEHNNSKHNSTKETELRTASFSTTKTTSPNPPTPEITKSNKSQTIKVREATTSPNPPTPEITKSNKSQTIKVREATTSPNPPTPEITKSNKSQTIKVREATTSPNPPTSITLKKNVATKNLEALTLPPLVVPEELTLVQEPTWKKNPLLFKNRVTLGVFTAVNSTVLLNNETRQSFDYNSLTINYFGLAANYGLWGRYRLHKKGAIVGEYSLNADHRQAYGIYRKGQFVVKEYVFNYNRISLAYQLDLWEDQQQHNHKITAQMGAYAGIRRGFQLYYNKVLVNDNIGDYHQYDAGLKIALGHEFIIDHFVIGYGIRSDIGLTNVFKGNKQLNAQQDRTNLIHLGGYLQLGYKF